MYFNDIVILQMAQLHNLNVIFALKDKFVQNHLQNYVRKQEESKLIESNNYKIITG